MSGRYLLGLTILLITTFCLADRNFTCSTTSVCAYETITCSCTLDSDADYVVWSVRDGGNMTVGSSVRLDSTNSMNTSWINMGNFTFSYFDDYSLATIRLSPQNNNYRIVCSLPEENSTLEVPLYSNAFNVTPIQSLQNLTLEFENVSRSYVTVNWTEFDDYCSNGYNVNISRDNGPPMTDYKEESYFKLENASSSVLYTFRVMPVAGFASEKLLNDLATMPQSIRLDVPLPVTNVRALHMPIAMNAQDGTRVNVTVRWDAMSAYRPRTMYYYITHNATRHLDRMESGMGSGSGSMSDDDDMSPSVFVTRRRMARMMGNFQRLLGAVVGETYTVSIIGENDIGNSTATSLTFTLTYMPPQPTSTTSVGMTSTPTSTPPMPSTSPTMDDDDESLPTWAIAVIAVGGGILLAVIIAVLVLVICCCCCAAAAAKRNEEHEMTEGTKL
ncbi:PREDICTED: uncharacterized protein LOC109581707 [Amphimedon queenslandica]|uniref:Fibronectin type-III domain-containing protein n=1 Tax=Amphimedon queenslandica TaxID=400682 RepID=A0A1X7UZH7_AMPQE|nr:PREDICTED: uncharacterized protein LOC109581707 [Amphimedon queenslandica]|eukprot:XP_019851605.1 PREDICTED: uncharacterized protein LOC109581707 [Amphimedon queenslandica]